MPGDIRKLCRAVLRYGFNSAFVNACYVRLAKRQLRNRARVGTVVSFPLGQDTTSTKLAAALDAAKAGADELDISMNVGLFKAKEYSAVLREMRQIVRAVKRIKPKIVIKFIIEAGYLGRAEIAKASQLVLASGADFVKTCSGAGPRGAEISDVKIIRRAVGDKIRIKVAGGITTRAQALGFIRAGADRIGTSHAIQIVKGVV
jgi:deoxyribose-phosphate aldolase